MSPTDETLIAGARAYVDALLSHDPTAVPLAESCTRAEMGVRTGRNGPHIRRSLARGPQFRIIHAVSDFHADVTREVVHATYRVHTRPRRLGICAEVSETFEFDDTGRIIRIEARFGAPHRN